ncbi:leucine--tRNA ligase [Candidatus Uhrbacteria bacterium]|nr:leucine--tRNA ligase [Candidatus Uhrbacteria bacterium]
MRYDHRQLEQKWQERWACTHAGAARDGDVRPKEYLLVEFPYPSGEGLHVGHLRSYTAMDIIARKRRMEGKNVLYPIGWDAFGLPAENYAIKTGQHPRVTTEKNCTNFRRQLQAMGFSFDWAREVNTTDPAYYRWTQWIFLQLLQHGLAYKAKMPINWCPKCKIGLANEEATGGVCERCGGPVEKRDREQWMLKITAYAEKLLAGLDAVDYIERAKAQQRNWIGRSEGATIAFALTGIPGQADGKHHATVFTTRPDTLFGATFLVVSPELAQQWMDIGWQAPDAVRTYVGDALRRQEQQRLDDTKEKTGVDSGIFAMHPATEERIPVWIADYVLGNYGTGAIMAVPAHDARDFAFAQRYGLPVRMVVCPNYPEPTCPVLTEAYTGEGHLVDSGTFTGMRSEDARRAMVEAVGGKITVTYKLRDWVFSRQRYWGEPIPVVFCAACGTVPVPEDQLPVLLPEVERYQPTDTGESPLANITEWVHTTCPSCGGPARRETDVMPNWAGSSWYFLRYIDPKNDRALADPEKLQRWMPIDWYNGGMEHTTLHLLYSRFWNLFLHDIGAVPVAEPYQKRTSHGIILGPDGEKMSKSRGNVINPDAIVEQFGADAVRVYEMFIGPFDQMVPWSTDGLVGCRRFLERVASLLARVEPKLADSSCGTVTDRDLLRMMHRTMQRVTEDIEGMHFNTAVSALMEYTNALAKQERIPFLAYVTLLTLLAPFAPHLAEELHEQLPDPQAPAHTLAEHPWPVHDPAQLTAEVSEVVVQVNGKVRATISMPITATADDAQREAEQHPAVQRALAGRLPRRVIVLPGKLVNFVVDATK